MRNIFLLSLLAFAVWHWHGTGRQLPPIGVAAPANPSYQIMTNAPSWPLGETDCNATPYVTYHLRARVLGTKRYHDSAGDVAPYDFVLGWGRMSDPAIYAPLEVTPRLRSFSYQPKGCPIPRAEIEAHSAAWHLIPADEDVAGKLGAAGLDDIVTLDGYLVAVRWPEGSPGLPSVPQTTANCAACHMFRVTHLAIEPRMTP